MPDDETLPDLLAITNLLGADFFGRQLLAGATRWRRQPPTSSGGEGKKALVLTGGGAKGAFEAGAVQRLWNDGYRPDIITGVSVGALNALKLAEGRDSSADDLVAIWNSVADTAEEAIRRSVHPYVIGDYVIDPGSPLEDGVNEFLARIAEEAADTSGLWATVAGLFGGPVGNGLFAAQWPFSIEGEVRDNIESKVMAWLRDALGDVHSVYTAHGLRSMIRKYFQPHRVRDSGIELRVGLVNSRTGEYYSCTQAPESFTRSDARWGRIIGEYDNAPGGGDRRKSWARNAIFPIVDAVYASATLPVFMDPVYGVEGDDVLIGDQFYKQYLPNYPMFRDFVAAGTPWRGFRGMPKGDPLLDGGLRDVAPIRTAMAMGARDITIISGSALQRGGGRAPDRGAVRNDPTRLPIAQYLLGLLDVWGHDVATNDIRLALAMNEFTGWLYRSTASHNKTELQNLVTAFNHYMQNVNRDLRVSLGTPSWTPQSGLRDADEHMTGPGLLFTAGAWAKARANIVEGADYVVPFLDEGCTIRYIAPSSPVIETQDFTASAKIRAALEQGRDDAQRPDLISHPVADDEIGSGPFISTL